MVLNYCDDQIWLCPDNDKIEEHVGKLKDLGYDLTLEDKGDNVFAFLGIEIQHHDGMIEMTQKGLIDKVIQYLDMTNASGKESPAASEPLGTDANGAPFKETWSYPAAIGMLCICLPTPDQICNLQCIKQQGSLTIPNTLMLKLSNAS